MVPDEWPIWGFGASRELAGSRNWVLGWGGVMPMRAPAVAVRVDCKAYPDLPKFLEALKKLANTPVKTRLNDIPLSELEGCGRYPPFQEMKDMLWRTGGCRTEHVAGRATERPLTASSYWYAG
uniref:Uncharacterized protein n=1 Tax=Oryza barthii TaxID=65489 RepID=A0A0D3G8S3_9ORYZ